MAGIASTQVSTRITAGSGEEPGRYRAPLAVLTSLFFLWGFLTCLNDILVPHLKAVFELGYAEAMMIQLAFFAAYFVASLPAGALVRRVGYQAGIVIGLLVAALGCAAFYPAASGRSYPLFLAALFVLASGITLLQVAANPFVAALGPPESAPSRLTLTQAFNALGTTLAPLFGSVAILSTSVKSPAELTQLAPSALDAYREAEAAAVQRPYLALAATLVALSLAMALLRLPRIEDSRREAPARLWRHRHLVLGALAIFLYVGAEVAIGSFLVSFFQLPTIGGSSETEGAKLVSFYWGGAMLGRFLGALTLRAFPPGKVLCAHALGALLLVLAATLGHGSFALYAILAVGLCNSVLFPTIFALAIRGLGNETGQASGFVCMAIVGGAIVPVAQGALADAIGVQHALSLAALCYAYVAWYGARGSVVR